MRTLRLMEVGTMCAEPEFVWYNSGHGNASEDIARP